MSNNTIQCHFEEEALKIQMHLQSRGYCQVHDANINLQPLQYRTKILEIFQPPSGFRSRYEIEVGGDSLP